MRLLLFSLSITVGVAALVAIGSFRQSLSQSIDDQARTLLGADLIIESTRPFTITEEEFLGSIGGAQAREVRLSTMAVFLGRGTRLVHLRALSGRAPCGAEAGVKGPGATSSRIYRCAPSRATLSLAPAADVAKYASDPRHGTR